MDPQKVFVIGQLLAQVVHPSRALQHRSPHQMQPQGAAQHLAVFQPVQLHPGDAALAPEDQAHAAALFALGNDRVHQTEKVLLPDGLELVEIGSNGIGLHGKFRRRCKKNDLYVVVIPADLPGGIDAVFPGHEHVQQQDVEPHSLFDLRQQFQRTLKGRRGDLRVSLHLIAAQQHLQLAQNRQIVVAQANLNHESPPFGTFSPAAGCSAAEKSIFPILYFSIFAFFRQL